MKDLTKNTLTVINSNIADAITTDLPIIIATTYALHSNKNPLPSLEDIVLRSAFPLMLATGSYFVRDLYRGKVLDLNVEKERVKESVKGGIIAGALKYTAYSIFNINNLATSSVVSYAAVGALNTALYESTRFSGSQILSDNNKPALIKLAMLSALYSSIELLSTPLLDISSWATSADYNAANSHFDYTQTSFNPYYFLQKTIPNTLIGGIITAAAVALVNVPFAASVRSLSAPVIASYLCCCAAEALISPAVNSNTESLCDFKSIVISAIALTIAPALANRCLDGARSIS